MLPFGKCAILLLRRGPLFCRCNGEGPFLLTGAEGGWKRELKRTRSFWLKNPWARSKCTCRQRGLTSFLGLVTHTAESPRLIGDLAHFRIPQILSKEGWPLPVWPRMWHLRRLSCLKPSVCLCSMQRISCRVGVTGAEAACTLTKCSSIHPVLIN